SKIPGERRRLTLSRVSRRRTPQPMEETMRTVDERYAAATRYVDEVITSVESRGIGYAIDPATGKAEWYAGRAKVAPAREDLERIRARWLRATADDERERTARD